MPRDVMSARAWLIPQTEGALSCAAKAQAMTRTFSAWGPFWPCAISNSTR
jgi:hypothetical protein